MEAVLTGLAWFDHKDVIGIESVRSRYTYPHPREPSEVFTTYVDINDRIGIPYGDKEKLKRVMGSFTAEDRRVSEPFDESVELTGLTLRPYQEEALSEVESYLYKENGTSFNLSGAPGSGKSVMLSAIIAKLGVKTLIIAHLSMLTEQLKNEIEQFTNTEVTVLDKNNQELGDVNIATSQFISLNPELWYKIKKHIGLIVADEAESIASKTTMRIFQRCHAKYRIAVTATFTRSVDGRTPALKDIIGHKVITLVNDKLIKPTVIAIRCPEYFKAPRNKNWYKKALVSFFKKNHLTISKKVERITLSSLAKGRQVLVATDLNDYQAAYAEHLSSFKVQCGIMNGATSKKNRPLILEAFDKQEVQVLLGFGVLNAGLSIPRISTIIRVSTPGNIEKLEQLIGRGRRDYDGKDGMFFLDLMFSGFDNANDKRRAFYRRKAKQDGWKFFETSWENFNKKLGE